MDGDQTKDTLDALADLFLTGTIPGGTKPVRVPPPSTLGDESADDDASSPTVDRSTDDSVASQLDGPESIPLHGKPSRQDEEEFVPSKPPISLRLHRDEDEDEHDDGVAERRALPASRVEALFVGNLPGWSGPWLVQYAHHLATLRGPVAMLHVDDDQVEIELVTANRRDLEAIDQATRSDDVDPTTLFSLLDVLTFNLDAPVATWLVHLPAPAEPKQKARAAEMHRWSVLTGADDTAIAAGHRLLGQLMGHAGDEQDGHERREVLHRIGAMLMGCDEARAMEAVDRFNTASNDLLPRAIELIGHRAAMEPVHVKQYGPFTGDTLWPRVVEYLAELDPSTDDASAALADAIDADDLITAGASIPHELPSQGSESFTAEHAEDPTKVSAAELEALGVTGDLDDDGDDSGHDEVLDESFDVDEAAASGTLDRGPVDRQGDIEPVFASASASRPEPELETGPEPELDAEPESESAVFDQAEAVATPARETAKPSLLQMAAADTAGSGNGEPDLAAMLVNSIGGGVALEAKCPRQPDKQIVLDKQGHLHLLRQHVDRDVRGSIVDLLETRDWVSEHIELLALTQRQNTFNTDTEPTLHLFADDAKAAVSMVSKLGPSVKLHLVQRVDVGTQSTWICTDLN